MLPTEFQKSLRTSLHGTTACAYFDRIVELIRPAVSLDICLDSQNDDVISRIGGAPDVPAGWEWPIGPEGPLRFLAQVQLEELFGLPAASLLPIAGVLAFFFGPELYGPSSSKDYQIARVYHFGSSSLSRATPPRDANIQPAFDLFPAEYWDMPTDDDHFATELFYRDIPADERETVACDLIKAGCSSGAMQLLGYPSREQDGFLQLECEAYTQGYDYRTMRVVEEQLRKKAHEWEVLAQFYLAWTEIWPDSNDGYLHFWIRSGDLAASDFSKICYTWERS